VSCEFIPFHPFHPLKPFPTHTHAYDTQMAVGVGVPHARPGWSRIAWRPHRCTAHTYCSAAPPSTLVLSLRERALWREVSGERSGSPYHTRSVEMLHVCVWSGHSRCSGSQSSLHRRWAKGVKGLKTCEPASPSPCPASPTPPAAPDASLSLRVRPEALPGYISIGFLSARVDRDTRRCA
jgi:hypothetical protein